MLVGIITDSHDNLPKIKQAIELFKERGVDAIIHAGDIISPFAAKLFLDIGIDVYAVFGNNDGELGGLAGVLDIAPPPRELTLGGKSFIVAHSPNQLPTDAAQNADVVISGHTHKIVEEHNAALLLNSGESCGYLTGRATVMVLNTDNMEVEICELP